MRLTVIVTAWATALVACGSASPAPDRDDPVVRPTPAVKPPPVVRPAPRPVVKAKPELACPAGTEFKKSGLTKMWCARPDGTKHGPFKEGGAAGRYADGELDGPWSQTTRRYRRAGQYTRGHATGKWELYDGGQLITRTHFDGEGRMHGPQTYFDSSGRHCGTSTLTHGTGALYLFNTDCSLAEVRPQQAGETHGRRIQWTRSDKDDKRKVVQVTTWCVDHGKELWRKRGERLWLGACATEPATTAEFAGIGIRYDEATHEILEVPWGAGAHQAGLEIGDVIARVDGKSAKRWTPDVIQKRLRGRPGSTVNLGVTRAGKPLTVTVARAPLPVRAWRLDEGARLGFNDWRVPDAVLYPTGTRVTPPWERLQGLLGKKVADPEVQMIVGALGPSCRPGWEHTWLFRKAGVGFAVDKADRIVQVDLFNVPEVAPYRSGLPNGPAFKSKLVDVQRALAKAKSRTDRGFGGLQLVTIGYRDHTLRYYITPDFGLERVRFELPTPKGKRRYTTVAPTRHASTQCADVPNPPRYRVAETPRQVASLCMEPTQTYMEKRGWEVVGSWTRDIGRGAKPAGWTGKQRFARGWTYLLYVVATDAQSLKTTFSATANRATFHPNDADIVYPDCRTNLVKLASPPGTDVDVTYALSRRPQDPPARAGLLLMRKRK